MIRKGAGMKKRNVALTIVVLILLSFSFLGCQFAKAQYTLDGASYPLGGGIGIISPSNAAVYRSSLLTLNITTSSLFDTSIYNYDLVYSIDGKNNATIPPTSFSFQYPNGQTGPMCIVVLLAWVALPQLEDGLHTLTVYATYERISSNTNWPPLIYDRSKTICVTINDGIPPIMANISVTNETYLLNNLTLSFTTDKPASWMGFSIDGKENLTITENTTLTALTNGPHNLSIYSNDSFGNMGASEPIDFSVDMPPTAEPLTANPITAEVGIMVSVAVMTILLIAFFKSAKSKTKIKKKN